MTFAIIVVVLFVICAIIEDGNGLTKGAVLCLLCALAFLLLAWITGWDFMVVLAKIAGAGVVLLTLINIIAAIVD